jgi:hypothetical protein
MNVQVLHVEVPACNQGITTGSYPRKAVVLRAMIADLRPRRLIDVDRLGILLSRTRIALRRNAHSAQDTRAPPQLPDPRSLPLAYRNHDLDEDGLRAAETTWEEYWAAIRPVELTAAAAKTPALPFS